MEDKKYYSRKSLQKTIYLKIKITKNNTEYEDKILPKIYLSKLGSNYICGEFVNKKQKNRFFYHKNTIGELPTYTKLLDLHILNINLCKKTSLNAE